MKVVGRRWGFNHSLRRLVRTLPLTALVPLGLAIGALFALLGPVTDLMKGGTLAAPVLIQVTAFSAVIAVGYAFASMRGHPWLMVALGCVNLLWAVLAPRGYLGSYPPLPAEFAAQRLGHDGLAILMLAMVSYTCFLWFINVTATRYLRIQAEMDLAHQIHQVLVPRIDLRTSGFELFGFSAASGEVGGDLIDVVDTREGWFGYVADVSGHGVSSGVVMGMFKSALRMSLRRGSRDIGALLDDLNVVILPLKSSAMYVTVACLSGGSRDTLEYAVAGHVPILRIRDGGVEDITTPQIPIGMFEDYRFTSATVSCAPGDLFALITDGLIEVFDAADRELGLEAVKTTLAAARGRPLREVADAVVAQARAHGRQLDDQSLLLVRRL
jgi:sigma-B regulation protein RsbU (phosphoserine phosphatase)